MKNLLIITLLLSATSAFASKARLEALGEDMYGSQYVNDNRNMFLNPAEIHNHHDFVSFDLGSTVAVDQESTPKASGTYFTKNNNATWGVSLGQNSNTANQLRAGGLAGTAAAGIGAVVIAASTAGVLNQNVLDFFYGRETSSMKWAVRFGYSSSKDENASAGNYDEISQNAYLVSFGALMNKWEFYANIGAGNNAKVKNIGGSGDDYDFQGGIGYQLGAIINLANGGKAFGEYRGITVKEKDILDEEWDISKIVLGYGKEDKMNDIFTAFYKAYFFQDTQTNVAFQDGSDNKETRITATIGMEAQANSWLTIRGSVSNNLMGEDEDEDGDKATITDAANVALGATIMFGDVALDGLIANDTNADGVGGDDNGNLRSDSLMTRVSMTYNF
jgi:hypothetical protein